MSSSWNDENAYLNDRLKIKESK